MRKLTVSEIQTYDICPQMWAWRYVAKRGVEDSGALRLGNALHLWFAARFKHEKVPPWKIAETAGLHEEDVEQAEVLDLLMPEWERRYGIKPPWEEVLMVEQELTLQRGKLLITGKPDAVVRWLGKLFHVQHKSVGRSVPMDKFVKGIAKSLHEAIYCTMLEKYGVVAGTMLNAVRKLSRNTVSRDPGQALHLEFIPISVSFREEALQEVVQRGMEMMELEKELDSAKPRAYRNRTMCNGKYGNSTCTYYGLCWEGQQPEELPKINPMERYEGGHDTGTTNGS